LQRRLKALVIGLGSLERQLRAQQFLLRVQLSQYAIKGLRGCRQSFRRRHHLLHHFFVHFP